MKVRNRYRDDVEDFDSGSHIYTYTGRLVKPMAFDVSMPTIIDIAHALSNIPRYNGHAGVHYSVAQHCSMLATFTARISPRPSDCLYMLLHDAAEAYIGDMLYPIKQQNPFFRDLDNKIMSVIWKWLKVDHLQPPPFLDEFDRRICEDERRVLRLGKPSRTIEPLNIGFEPWDAEFAASNFLQQYTGYMYGIHNKIVYTTSEWEGSAISSDDRYVTDLMEVDFLGRVGRIKVRNEDDGLLERDRNQPYPVPRWRWVHGDFTMTRGNHVICKK